jgi:hypothetical protein
MLLAKRLGASLQAISQASGLGAERANNVLHDLD